MKKSTFVVFFLSLLTTYIYSNIELNSHFYTTDNGLGNNFVRHIYQDSKGFLWMSTLNGLSRYDGHSFINFQPKTGKEISLMEHHVKEVKEDKNHLLWVQLSPENLSCYNLEQECFVDYTGMGDFDKSFSYRLSTNNGDTWISESNNGCRKISYSKGKFHSEIFNLKNGKLPSNQCKVIKEDAEGSIWIGTSKGLVKVSGENVVWIDNRISVRDIAVSNDRILVLSDDARIYGISANKKSLRKLFSLENENSSLPIVSTFQFGDNWIILTLKKGYTLDIASGKLIQNPVFDFPSGQYVFDKEGNVCMFNYNGQIRYVNKKTAKTIEFTVPLKDHITNMWCRVLLDSRGWVWFATFGNGLYVVNPLNGEMSHFEYQIDRENVISSNSLAYIFEDRSGGIWVSSESAGISHLTVLNDKIKYYYPEDKHIINTSNAVRTLFQESNGNIWVGNRLEDLYLYDSNLNKTKVKKQFNSSVYAISQDENTGNLWIGSRANGLMIQDKLYSKGKDLKSLSSEKISLLYQDYKNRTWVGTYSGGLCLAVPGKDGYTFPRYFINNSNFELMTIRSIAEDDKHWMWCGTDYGLIVFHPDSLIKSPSHYYQYTYEDNSILAKRVKYVYCDSKNRIWLGTMGGGLSLCENTREYSSLKFKHFPISKGLVNNVIQSITEDKSGKIWIATEYGMSKFSPETETFENFYFSKTIQGNVYNENSVLNLPDGRLLFGTNHGFVSFDPEKLKSPKIIADITLTDIKVNGISMHPNDEDSQLESSISYSKKIELQHFQNSFTIEFSTFDYADTKSSKYSYKLEPFDTEWSTPTTLNFASYKKLDPGSYELKVKACNSAGVWSEKETTLIIKIKHPWWDTPLAYILYLLILAVALFLVFRIMKNFYNLNNKLHIEQELTDYKLKFFTNISHEFRTPLTLIRGALDKIENSSELLPKEIQGSVHLMGKSTNKLLRLINQLLEFRKMQHNKLTLKLEHVEVLSFLKEIFEYFSELAADKKMDYQFDCPDDPFTMYIDKGNIDKVVFNLLSNALKYTPNGGAVLLSVKVNTALSQLEIRVSDNGKGIPVDKQGELFSRFMQSNFSQDSVGIGLHLTSELVNLHKGTITYHDNPDGGSVFTVTLPMENTAYADKDFVENQYVTENAEENFEPLKADEWNETMSEEASESGISKKNKILVIEDDIDVNHFLVEELGQFYEVIAAFDGLSGLEEARNFDGDLIVCDVMMPGMNGFEVTKLLKQDFETCHIPIVLLTAMNTPENKLEGTQNGADAYITKPFSTNYLISRIKQLISQRDVLRRKFSKEVETTSVQFAKSDIDRKFVDRLDLVLEKEFENTDFTIDDFATKLNLGRTSFFRKVKGVTGYTPNEYLRIYRLKKGMEFLKTGLYNVSEVTYMVGLNDPLYFSRCFRKQFGVVPSSLLLRGSIDNEEAR